MARESRKIARGFNWRLWLVVVALGVAGVSTAVAGFRVRQYALTDPQFMLSRDRPDALTIQGLNYTPRTKVQRVFTADFDHSIFSVPLAERRRRLLAIDWVEDASVSRIWPDRLLVRIRERKPVAFVLFRSGVLLIDATAFCSILRRRRTLRSRCSAASGKTRRKTSAASACAPCCGSRKTWDTWRRTFPR